MVVHTLLFKPKEDDEDDVSGTKDTTTDVWRLQTQQYVSYVFIIDLGGINDISMC